MTFGQTGIVKVAGRELRYHRDNRGQMVVSNDQSSRLVLDVIGQALATPVTALTIVFGNAMGEIYLEAIQLFDRIYTDVYTIKVQGEANRMEGVFHAFGQKIQEVANSNYPEDTKAKYRDNLMRRMDERLAQFKN